MTLNYTDYHAGYVNKNDIYFSSCVILHHIIQPTLANTVSAALSLIW